MANCQGVTDSKNKPDILSVFPVKNSVKSIISWSGTLSVILSLVEQFQVRTDTLTNKRLNTCQKLISNH